MGTRCSQHWWAAWIRKEVRNSGLGRRHGERLGEEKVGAKRRRTCGESYSENAEQLARREEDDSEAEYQFEDGGA